MNKQSLAPLLALVGLAFGVAQSPGRINPMIALHERGLPVFGVTHPPIVAPGRRPGPAPGANATEEWVAVVGAGIALAFMWAAPLAAHSGIATESYPLDGGLMLPDSPH